MGRKLLTTMNVLTIDTTKTIRNMCCLHACKVIGTDRIRSRWLLDTMRRPPYRNVCMSLQLKRYSLEQNVRSSKPDLGKKKKKRSINLKHVNEIGLCVD